MSLPGFKKFNEKFFIYHVLYSDSEIELYQCLDKKDHSFVSCLIQNLNEDEKNQHSLSEVMDNKISHKNLFNLIEVFKDNKDRSLVIVVEDKSKLSLGKYVSRFKKCNDHKDVIEIMKSLMSLASYLESQGVKLEYLTPNNIFVSVDDDTNEYKNVVSTVYSLRSSYNPIVLVCFPY